MNKTTNLKTDYRANLEKRNERVKGTYKKLVATPGAMTNACVQQVMQKYSLSRAQVFRIVAQ